MSKVYFIMVRIIYFIVNLIVAAFALYYAMTYNLNTISLISNIIMTLYSVYKVGTGEY